VLIDVPLSRLSRWTGPGRWELPPGTYGIDVGTSAGDPGGIATTMELQ
jgi:hypothetical protein